MPEKRKGPGRPRTRPDGAKPRKVYLTDAEEAAIRGLLSSGDDSSEEWKRRVLVGAIRRRAKG